MDQAARIDIQPFFLDGARGPLFCLYLAPARGAPVGGVLYLHPFAEEMHKSRHMAALQARALAARGHGVLQVDLTGCGDSAGDFGDAAWSAWRDDARLAHAWLAARIGHPITLWGLRTGATLAATLAGELAPVAGMLLWQPVPCGDVFLHQFLRIKLAGEMLAEGHARANTKALRAELAAGTGVEVGGYLLSPAMARELGAVKLDRIVPPGPVRWLEVAGEAGAPLMPASQRVVDAWRDAGVAVEAGTVPGVPFWITQEITECPALLAATGEGMRA